jgi:hypothetical protein
MSLLFRLSALMKNPFTLLCQPDSSEILTQDGVVPGSSSKLALGQQRSDRANASVTKQPHAKSFIHRIVPSVAVLTGLAMILAGCGSPPASESQTPNSPATPVSAKDVENYARAIWQIEQKRREAYGEIQQITQNQSFSDFTCTQPKQIAALANDLEKIAVNYCNQAKKIGESQGLTMTKFNEITRNAQSSPELQQRIQNEIVRLQSKQ